MVRLTAVTLFCVGTTGCAGDAWQPIFNGRDLAGWHASSSSPHGQTDAWHVVDGAIVGAQQPPGTGGVLLSDARFGNVEVRLEVKLCQGCDSGLFLRSSERGQAYQVMLDHVAGGVIGSVFGEQMEELNAPVNRVGELVWRPGDWNEVRARIEGDAPHITVWINGTQTTDWTDSRNHAADGAVEGALGLQVHGGGRWTPGGTLAVRRIAVRRID